MFILRPFWHYKQRTISQRGTGRRALSSFFSKCNWSTLLKIWGCGKIPKIRSYVCLKKEKIIINKTRNICRTVNSSVKIAKICHTDFVAGYFVNILLVSVRHFYKLIPKFLWLVFDKNGAKNLVLQDFCELCTSARCVAIQCAPSSWKILCYFYPYLVQ